MIRVNNNFAKAMEFTSFKKKDTVTDDELINAILQFEIQLAKQNGFIFHCLVRNFKNEYANVLFVENFENLNDIETHLMQIPEAQNFFKLIEKQSIKIEFHHIQKNNFQIPLYFSCIECGTFSLKNENKANQLLSISNTIETNYLNTFENTSEHFIGKIKSNKFSEITFGKTLGQTKKICFGYFQNPFCTPLLELADENSMELDFWYLIA